MAFTVLIALALVATALAPGTTPPALGVAAAAWPSLPA